MTRQETLAMPNLQSRRRLLGGLSGIGAAALLRTPCLRAEGPPETTSVRLAKHESICVAPANIADELLRAEGFTDIRHVPPGINVPDDIAHGALDFGLNFASTQVAGIDRGVAMKVLAGVHVGCFELFVHEGIRGAADLVGKKVGIAAVGSPEHLFVSLIVANVGIDPKAQIDWVTSGPVRPKQLFIDGKIDAFLGFPPEPQEVRAKHIGRVVFNSAADRPWSQYFCCMLAGRTDYVEKYPVATKRVVRAILKAADLCATEPARAARMLVDGGFDPALRLRAADAPGGPLGQVGRIRRRGHDALLRAAPARAGHHQDEPQAGPRRGHRLALLRRIEARAEGVSDRRSDLR
jgi:NitT/TauT family transport system substrate-binding protein